ncbi:H/ACA ribonucleoprotein complex subunit NHP2 [Penicillium odoratum]|uniref:H/ACA ribonucleoprotein complex subunit NHP2 n=1 Tax=Penicillium odoratum TaxID=1167516 RepID=UPI00254730E4|nr:H/ACA ribonucleoprotein complex subunit NHP2 [Penicillium odoratum]KAJ5753143.1 H/ACA ribonucleoprotein complex subunit NHP2 [Penicillium odoratum]
MGKDRVEKKEKRSEKKEKRADKDGVVKPKKEKKDKKDKTALVAAVEKEMSSPDVKAERSASPADVDVEGDEMAIDRPTGALVPFANPLVEDKNAKKVLKSVKKAAVNKSLKRGVKEVVKALRKSAIPAANATIEIPSGVVILAADISPMDVISHIPVLCEDHGIPYVFVSSRAELGASAATKRPTSVVMVTPKSAKKGKKDLEADNDSEDFGKVFEELAKLAEKELKKVVV